MLEPPTTIHGCHPSDDEDDGGVAPCAEAMPADTTSKRRIWSRQHSAFRHEIVHVRKTYAAGSGSWPRRRRQRGTLCEKNSVDPSNSPTPSQRKRDIQARALQHVIGSNAVEAVQMVQFPSEVHDPCVVTTEDEGGKEVPAWPVVVVTGGLSGRLARRRAVAVLLVRCQ